MTKDVTTQIVNLQQEIMSTLDALIIDPKYDYKPLLDNYKQLLSEFKIVKCENDIHTIVPKTTADIDSLIALNALVNKDETLYNFKPEITTRFFNLKEIIKGIKCDNFEPLSHFISENESKDDLFFAYQTISFLSICKEKSSKEAVLYARNNVFINGLDSTKNKYYLEFKKYLPLIVLRTDLLKQYNLLKQKLIMGVKNKFISLYGITSNNIFVDLLETGTNNMSSLLNFDWAPENENELPIELSVRSKYHSMFICPILKVFCENDNPPMRLKCGHVISKYAVDRLVKDKHLASFKCPYCPCDCTIEDIKKINL